MCRSSCRSRSLPTSLRRKRREVARDLPQVLVFQRTAYPSLIVALLYGLTLVFLFLTARDSDGELQLVSFIIHAKRHSCQAFLRLSAEDLVDFLSTEQKPTRSLWVVCLRRIAHLPRRDGGAHELRFASACDLARAA